MVFLEPKNVIKYVKFKLIDMLECQYDLLKKKNDYIVHENNH